jgi:hypothetical protein
MHLASSINVTSKIISLFSFAFQSFVCSLELSIDILFYTQQLLKCDYMISKLNIISFKLCIISFKSI